MAIVPFHSRQVNAFTALKVQIFDGLMEPDFPCGQVAIVVSNPLLIEPGMAVCVELPDNAQVIRWFIGLLEDGRLLLAVNPFSGQPRLQITQRNSRVIGVVINVESVVCESEMLC
jgi:hypothetical protein